MLVRAALNPEIIPDTVRKVPAPFRELLRIIEDLTKEGAPKTKDLISKSAEEFAALARERCGLKGYIDSAKYLLKHWGRVYVLDDGSVVVLNPQKLGQVLACIFTKVHEKQQRLGEAKTGLLVHSDELSALSGAAILRGCGRWGTRKATCPPSFSCSTTHSWLSLCPARMARPCRPRWCRGYCYRPLQWTLIRSCPVAALRSANGS